jgi:hypothetical protein
VIGDKGAIVTEALWLFHFFFTSHRSRLAPLPRRGDFRAPAPPLEEGTMGGLCGEAEEVFFEEDLSCWGLESSSSDHSVNYHQGVSDERDEGEGRARHLGLLFSAILLSGIRDKSLKSLSFTTHEICVVCDRGSSCSCTSRGILF